MTLKQVFNALEVAHSHSFSKAAEKLFLSQPALSLQIKKLEEELGYSLFLRTPQGIFLTEDGKNFCHSAQSVADSWEQFSKEVQGKCCRHLHIGMGSRVYTNGLFEEIVHFFEEHPEIEVTFVTEAGQDFFSGLREGTLDLALDRIPAELLLPDLQNYSATDLIRERQCVLVSKNDPRSRQREMGYSALHGCTIITGLEDSLEERTLKQDCKDFGVTLKRVFHSDGMETVMRLVQGGRGAAIGPLSFANYYDVAAIPLTPEKYFSLQFICLNKNANRTEIRLLRRHLMQVCQERGATR